MNQTNIIQHQQYLKSFFNGLTFIEETHKYFVNDEPIKMSVSGKYGRYGIPFNKLEKSQSVANREGRTQESVLKEWDAAGKKAIDIGNKAHLFGELYAFNRSLKPKTKYDKAIVKFWNDLPSHIVVVATELQMYHKEFMYAGTADIILYNTKTGKYIIGDYKTNKDLHKNFANQKLLGPFCNILDTPLNKYQLQLSYYQILLEQIPNLEVSHRKIISIKDNGKYEIFNCNDYTKYLN